MRFGSTVVALSITIATACPAAAEDSSAIAPSTPWTINYGIDSCALRRMFGEGDNRVYLELARFEPGHGLQAIVASNRMEANNPTSFKFRFDDADWRQVAGVPTVSMPDGFNGVIFNASLFRLPELAKVNDPRERDAYLRTIDVHAMENEFAAKTDTLLLRGAFWRDVLLQLGPLEKPMGALNACIDELMTHWGIDVEAHKTLTRSAVPVNLREGARMIDYPPKMRQRSMPGVVNIRLAIDETGGITGCRIQLPLSDPSFEESTCADLQHALDFDPALDKDGKPIASYWVTKVAFIP